MQSTMHCARKKRQDGQQTKLFHLTICLTGVLRPIIAEIRANTGGERRLTCGSRVLFFAQGAARGAKCSPLEMRERAALMCNNYKKGVCALPHIRTRSKRVGLTAHTYIYQPQNSTPVGDVREFYALFAERVHFGNHRFCLAQSCAEFEYKRVANKVHVSQCH